MDNMKKQLQAEKKAVAKAVQQTIKACDKKVRIDEVLAEVFAAHQSPAMYIEWMLDKFWAIQSAKLWGALNKIHRHCVENIYTENKSFDFNDYDDELFYIPHPNKQILVHKGQSHRHLYIWHGEEAKDPMPLGFRRLHIRKFYDVWTMPDKDRFAKRELADFVKATKEKGYQPAINMANEFVERYSDFDYQYPHRLSLECYKKANFEVQYGDSRDEGYICSWEEFAGRVSGAIMSHYDLKTIHECHVPNIIYSLSLCQDDL